MDTMQSAVYEEINNWCNLHNVVFDSEFERAEAIEALAHDVCALFY